MDSGGNFALPIQTRVSSFSIKADTVGAAASFLCMIHCVATPFLFVAQACASTCCSAAPTWWRAIDFAFLLVSAVAVLRAVKASSTPWLRWGLRAAWVALAAAILAENFAPALFSEWVKYPSAFSLIGLHLYNMKYGCCDHDNCIVHG